MLAAEPLGIESCEFVEAASALRPFEAVLELAGLGDVRALGLEDAVPWRIARGPVGSASVVLVEALLEVFADADVEAPSARAVEHIDPVGSGHGLALGDGIRKSHPLSGMAFEMSW